MKAKLLTGTIGAILMFGPILLAQDQKPSPTENKRNSGMSDDVRRAVEWERAKDRAAARQAAIEARREHREQNADRIKYVPGRSQDVPDEGRKVKDTKAPGDKK